MKQYAITTACFTLVMLIGLGLHYCLVVVPEQRDRETQKQAMLAFMLGDRAEAAVILSGRENARFQVLAQELSQ